MSAVVFVRLDRQLAARLDATAARARVSRPDLVRSVLDEALPPAPAPTDPNQLRAFDEVSP